MPVYKPWEADKLLSVGIVGLLENSKSKIDL